MRAIQFNLFLLNNLKKIYSQWIACSDDVHATLQLILLSYKKHRMNLLPGILLCTLLILFGCKKSNLSALALTGTWNWNATYNDGAPGLKNPLTPVNSGIIQKLIFTKNEWSLTQNGVIVSKGSYSTSAPGIFLGKYYRDPLYARKQ